MQLLIRTKVNLLVIRDGKEKEIVVTLGERPDDLAQGDRKLPAQTQRLGIEVENLTNETARQYGHEGEEGVIVVNVKRNSAPYDGGLREGDLIKQIDRKAVKNISDYNKIINDIKPGESVLMRVKKQNGHYYVSFKMPTEE